MAWQVQNKRKGRARPLVIHDRCPFTTSTEKTFSQHTLSYKPVDEVLVERGRAITGPVFELVGEQDILSFVHSQYSRLFLAAFLCLASTRLFSEDYSTPGGDPGPKSYMTEKEYKERWECYLSSRNAPLLLDHRNCLRAKTEEWTCKALTKCKWQPGARQCWGLEFAQCYAALRSQCHEIQLVEEFPPGVSQFKKFVCGPNGQLTR